MLINRIFNGNDAVYGLTVNAVDEAVKEHAQTNQWAFPIRHIACHVITQYRQ